MSGRSRSRRVIDLHSDLEQGRYATLDEARGSVKYDALSAWAIWKGNVRIECYDPYRGDDDRARQGLGEC